MANTKFTVQPARAPASRTISKISTPFSGSSASRSMLPDEATPEAAICSSSTASTMPLERAVCPKAAMPSTSPSSQLKKIVSGGIAMGTSTAAPIHFQRMPVRTTPSSRQGVPDHWRWINAARAGPNMNRAEVTAMPSGEEMPRPHFASANRLQLIPKARARKKETGCMPITRWKVPSSNGMHRARLQGFIKQLGHHGDVPGCGVVFLRDGVLHARTVHVDPQRHPLALGGPVPIFKRVGAAEHLQAPPVEDLEQVGFQFHYVVPGAPLVVDAIPVRREGIGSEIDV